jgi:ubiquinone/menaquinone biosynthesis C-methylase UbiE
MIPFNHLGLPFKLFSSWVYPRKVKIDLSALLRDMDSGSFVLDIGAGTGVLSGFSHAIRNDLRYVALDPAYGMLRYVPRYVYKIIAMGEAVPCREGTFSLVLMGDAIHHMEDPRKALLEIRNVLKPEGRLFIFDLDPDTSIGGMIRRIERLLNEPANFTSPESLSSLLSDHGFSATVNRYGWTYSVTATLR